ncbi:DUF3368 domain-containing protein [Endothiovibrio diazotrophicus]
MRASSSAAAIAEGWLTVVELSADSTDLKRLIDPGEAEAILLAGQIACRFLLIDERRGRAVARRRGVPVVGTGGLLVVAKERGAIGSVREVLAELAGQGYRLAPALLEEIRRLAGE